MFLLYRTMILLLVVVIQITHKMRFRTKKKKIQ